MCDFLLNYFLLFIKFSYKSCNMIKRILEELNTLIYYYFINLYFSFTIFIHVALNVFFLRMITSSSIVNIMALYIHSIFYFFYIGLTLSFSLYSY